MLTEQPAPYTPSCRMSISCGIVFIEMAEKHRYEMKKRAERQRETRRRIVEATVELHRTRGPANTTISEIAKRAGVNRLTVYNHFPDMTDLLRACSRSWTERHPAPDPTPWARIGDPQQRLRTALIVSSFVPGAWKLAGAPATGLLGERRPTAPPRACSQRLLPYLSHSLVRANAKCGSRSQV